ncbi:MAG: Uma2 family endonuclease [Planctomycetota bacterium]
MPLLDTPTQPPTRRPSLPDRIPELQNGDRLSHEEFMRRYEAMPGVTAELIDGTVYMASPVRLEQHGKPHARIVTWLGTYCSRHADVEIGDNVTLILGRDTDPQPDACLLLPESRGGRAKLVDGYVHGPPELVVEVAASTASLDANAKAEAYHAAGVPEYLLWRVEEERIDWYERLEDRYLAMVPNADGLIESKHFEGLKLNPEALLRGDLAKVLGDVAR